MYLCETCTLRLKIDAQVATTGALHTYLYSADVRDELIGGLSKSYIDSLLNDELVSAIDEVLLIDKAIDRIYLHNPSETLLGDRLVVKHDNHSDVVVWSPWQEGAKDINDMLDDDYIHMVCIETARISQPFESIDNIIGVEISCSR
jgi:glucose-6-phosphate 1-epimerase